jgi:hypothetical protein
MQTYHANANFITFSNNPPSKESESFVKLSPGFEARNPRQILGGYTLYDLVTKLDDWEPIEFVPGTRLRLKSHGRRPEVDAIIGGMATKLRGSDGQRGSHHEHFFVVEYSMFLKKNKETVLRYLTIPLQKYSSMVIRVGKVVADKGTLQGVVQGCVDYVKSKV